MKKTLSFLVFTFLAIPVFAQHYSFGIRGGFNYSTLSGDVDAVGQLRGFNAGGFWNIEMDNFAIQPGVFYSVKGVRENVRVTDPVTSVQTAHGRVITLNYIQIPINTIYRFPTNSPVRFYLGGGPYFADAISGWESVPGQPKKDLSFDDYYRIDFGIAVIGGIELQRKIILGFNYDMGITPVSQMQTRIDIVNRTLGFSVGYRFK
jgi:hypothetical protein